MSICVSLEFSGKVLGRQKFDIKICACPFRDKESDEKSVEKSGNDGKSTKIVKKPVDKTPELVKS